MDRIEAYFEHGENEVTIDGLTQHDKDVLLHISGDDIPDFFELHMDYYGRSSAMRFPLNKVDGVATIKIPNELLKQRKTVRAWVYVIDGEGCRTKKTIILPIIQRNKADDVVSGMEEEQKDSVEQLIQASNELIDECDELIKNTQKTVVSHGSDYGEISVWYDGNPNNEDRLYRFVTIYGDNREIKIADSDDQIVGTSNIKGNVGFLGNYTKGDEFDRTKTVVSILGVSYVKTNDNTIEVNDRVMSDMNGYAIKSSNNLGYRVIRVVEDGLLEIVVLPNSDVIQRIKTDIVTKLTQPQTANVGQIFRVQAVNEDGTITVEAVDASECAVTDVQIEGTSIVDENGVAEMPIDFAKYKYFNFIEAGVDIEGNPTYDEIKEAVDNGYIPFLKYGHDGVAHMTISNCGPNDDQNRGQFTFVAANSRADMGWIMEVNEFWCYLQDDGSTLWRSGAHYSEAFIAEYDVTPVEAVLDAYEKGLEIIVKRSATPDNPAHYARLVRADGYGVTPNLTFTCEENQLSHHYHINGEGWHYWCYNLEQKLFIAEYGVTKNSEILSAYKAGKTITLRVPKGTITNVTNKEETFLPLSYAEGSGDARNFVFTTTNNGQILHCMVATDNVWKYYVNDLNSRFGALEHNFDNIAQYINGKDPMLSALSSMNTVDILKSVYNFRGGFCDNAGTLHIKNPGIYLIMQGGIGNKQITINYPTGKEFEATKWNGIILLAYEGGVVTPIGIESSLTIAGAFKTPGTFQGWTSDGRYSTTINYPAKCVVAYLGNSNVDYLE